MQPMMGYELSFDNLKFDANNTIFLSPEELIKQYGLAKDFYIYVLTENDLHKVRCYNINTLVREEVIFENFHLVCTGPMLEPASKHYFKYIFCKAKPLQSYLREYLVKKHKEQAKFIAGLLK